MPHCMLDARKRPCWSWEIFSYTGWGKGGDTSVEIVNKNSYFSEALLDCRSKI